MARITWQNVYGGKGNSEASQILGTAQRTFDGIFDRAGQLLQDNQQRRTDDNTRAFMDFVGQFRTPEELQAAMESGAIDQQRMGYGRMIDDALARNAAQSQLESLRAGTLAADQFNHRGTLNQIALDAAGGNTEGAFDAARDVPASVLSSDFIKSLHEYEKSHNKERREQGKHDSDMQTARQNRTRTGQIIDHADYDFTRRQSVDTAADAQDEWSQQLSNLALQAGNAVRDGQITGEEATALFRDQLTRAAQDIGAERALSIGEQVNPAFGLATTAFGPERVEQERRAQQAAAEEEDWRANSPAAVGSREAQRNQDDLVKWINEVGGKGLNDDEIQHAHRALGEIFRDVYVKTPDGTRIGPTQEIIKTAFLTAEPGWFRDTTKSKKFKDEVKRAMNDPIVIERLFERHARDRAVVTGDAEELKSTLNSLRR